MKKMKFMSLVAATAMISTMSVAPIFAAETSTAGTEVTYTANSASTDKADWLVSYPKKVVLSDYNDSASNGESMPFELRDKLTSDPYSGSRTVTVTVTDYTTSGFDMTAIGGATGSATMAIADSGGDDLDPNGSPTANLIGSMKKVNGGAENKTTGWAYIKNKSNPEGSFSKNVTFTFTDDAIN